METATFSMTSSRLSGRGRLLHHPQHVGGHLDDVPLHPLGTSLSSSSWPPSQLETTRLPPKLRLWTLRNYLHHPFRPPFWLLVLGPACARGDLCLPRHRTTSAQSRAALMGKMKMMRRTLQLLSGGPAAAVSSATLPRLERTTLRRLERTGSFYAVVSRTSSRSLRIVRRVPPGMWSIAAAVVAAGPHCL